MGATLDTSSEHSVAFGRLPAATRMGPVELTVTDLERSAAFYAETIGLEADRRDGGSVAMRSGGADVLVLFERPAARRAGVHAGLYHVALLYPTRLELARAARRLAEDRAPIEGASDHGTHEAIYLPDPDGIGLELAADRPRGSWPDPNGPGGFFRGGPRPLDLAGLLGLTAEQETAPRSPVDGLGVGHVHLHVADAGEALRFYRDLVGFEPTLDLTPSAVFLAAGGYHHHVAANTWRGAGVAAAPGDAVGLRHFTVVVPTAGDVEDARRRAEAAGVTPELAGAAIGLSDPSGNGLRIEPEMP